MIQVFGSDGYNKKVAVLGGNGFIGHHIARRYKSLGWYVLAVDIKECEYGNDHATDILIGDLRLMEVVERSITGVNLVIQLAADMGGCQYIFTGDHDADIMRNSAQINMNVCDAMVRLNPKAKVFYSSSACMYPQQLQIESNHIGLKETDAYPGNPDSEYGWEKLFSERLYLSYARNYGLDVRIARYHNIYGPEGTYKGGKEKAPASITRKVIEASDHIYMWGNGLQTRSFLYIDDCVDATLLLIESDHKEPINIGSDYSIAILYLWDIAIEASGKKIEKRNTEMPKNYKGVQGRNSNNFMIRKVLNWEPKNTITEGMTKLYNWIKSQYDANI